MCATRPLRLFILVLLYVSVNHARGLGYRLNMTWSVIDIATLFVDAKFSPLVKSDGGML